MMTAEIESIKIPTRSYYNVSADIWRSLGVRIIPCHTAIRKCWILWGRWQHKEIPQEIQDRWKERPGSILDSRILEGRI
jgi:hypothetical protein